MRTIKSTSGNSDLGVQIGNEVDLPVLVERGVVRLLDRIEKLEAKLKEREVKKL